MLIFNKLLALAVGFGSLALTTAYSPVQAVMRNIEYENQGYRILQSKNVNGYSIRIKNTPSSCEEGVQYSGYIDKHDTDDHFFFYFFESRTDPKNDPTVLWLNGGPGCSSMLGLWMELGPCQVNSFGNDTIRNPYSWNTAANLIFLDQPVNVGYSYGKTKVKSTLESGRDVYAFLQLFFSEYSEYANNSFHISGESYAGHYLPAISSEIIRHNKAIPETRSVDDPIKINFQSVLIGNGWTEPLTQFREYETFGCGNYSQFHPIFDKETCDSMSGKASRCEKLTDACYKFPSKITCFPADVYCERLYNEPFDKTGLNPYDIRRKCEGDNCYAIMEAIDKYANSEEVRKNLGVDEKAGNYTGCSDSVGYRFGLDGDNSKDVSGLVVETLEAGVRVLLYVGDMDYICNWVGNLKWSLKMEWSGKEGYNNAPEQKWFSDLTGEHAGSVKTYGNLTFLKIFDAGHMV
ncbi:unnamed protein product [Mucor hiemalis]